MNALTTPASLTDLARAARKALAAKDAAAATLNATTDADYDHAAAVYTEARAAYTEARAALVTAMRGAGVASVAVDGDLIVDASADRRDDHMEGEPVEPSLLIVPTSAAA